jgi:hypothetical protein
MLWLLIFSIAGSAMHMRCSRGHYVDVKLFYAIHFNIIPAISFIGDVDGSKAFKHLHDRFKYKVAGIYQHSYFDHDKKDIFFNNTVFVFKDKRMIELAGNYCMYCIP